MKIILAVFVFILAGAIFAQPLITLDFESDSAGEFPSEWTSKKEKDMKLVYFVREEDGNKFLRGDAGGLSVQIGYEAEWELEKYPHLSWKWRAVTLPESSNEHEKSGNDNVLGMYVVFGGWPIPRNIKYIWSETLPVGTELPSPFTGKTKMVVLRSGADGAGEWLEEERNILDDYRRLFGEPDATPTARGIGVLTDSDNTDTEAVGDYDDIRVLPKGEE